MAYIDGKKVLFSPRIDIIDTGVYEKAYDEGRMGAIRQNETWEWWGRDISQKTLFESLKYEDTSDTKDFYRMFRDCAWMTKAPLLDTSAGESFFQMYSHCTGLSTIPEINTSNGKNFNNFVLNCSKLTKFPLIDTSKGEQFGQMFAGCISLKTIPLIDTSKGKYFYQMFASSGLPTIPNLDVSNGETFESMFYESKIETVPRLNTIKGKNFKYMFKNAVQLKRIEGINISSVENASDVVQMFEMNYRLEVVKFEGVIPVSIDFNGCTNLTGDCIVDIVKHLKIFKPSDSEYKKHKISFYASAVWDRATEPIEYEGKSLSVKEYVDAIGWLRNM